MIVMKLQPILTKMRNLTFSGDSVIVQCPHIGIENCNGTLHSRIAFDVVIDGVQYAIYKCSLCNGISIEADTVKNI